ncbi:MAG: glycosyltransferase [Methanobrevibacter sp.]|nr:glycosyltransferase [Methanobrevibacter sp.]
MVRISVIVPVYNCEDYLEESLGSILKQTFNDIEVICIDDGSTDDSLGILNEMASSDSRIQVFPQENQGAGAVRNYGMKKASGDYVYFFDADDYLLKEGLEKAYSNAIRNDSDIVFFKFDQYKDNRFFTHSGPNLEMQFVGADFDNFTFDWHDYRTGPFTGPFAPWLKLYKKEFLDAYDCFRFPNDLNHNDVPFHVMTFLKASKISFVPEHLYRYRIDNAGSITNNRLKKYDHIFRIIQIVEDFLLSEDYMEEFKREFDYFKANRITYEMYGRPEEYFYLAKEELKSVDLGNGLLSNDTSFKAKTILSSNSLEEYNYKIKVNEEINSLKRENKSLADEINSLKGKNKSLMDENKSLNEKFEKSKTKNREILNSKSWKITGPLRRLRKKF